MKKSKKIVKAKKASVKKRPYVAPTVVEVDVVSGTKGGNPNQRESGSPKGRLSG